MTFLVAFSFYLFLTYLQASVLQILTYLFSYLSLVFEVLQRSDSDLVCSFEEDNRSMQRWTAYLRTTRAAPDFGNVAGASLTGDNDYNVNFLGSLKCRLLSLPMKDFKRNVEFLNS